MKLFVGFLLGSKLLNEGLWKAWLERFEPGTVQYAAHCWKGDYEGWLPMLQVPTEWTDWAHTIRAHGSLYRAFLESNCDYLAICSESCAPCKTPEETMAIIAGWGGKSALTGLHIPNMNDRKVNVYRNRLRHADREYWSHARLHEQWVVLARRHVEALVKNWDAIVKAFRRVPADNELYLGTALSKLGLIGECVAHRCTYVQWPIHTSSHPENLNFIRADLINTLDAQGCLFARKIPATAKGLELLEERISKKL